MQRIAAVAREKLGIAEGAPRALRPLQGEGLAQVPRYAEGEEGRQADPRYGDDADAGGEGKTTTTVGLGDALNHIGKKP